MTKHEPSSLLTAASSAVDRRVPQLLRGQLRSRGDKPSLIFMTVHKCASSYVADVLTRIALSQKIEPIDIESFVWRHTAAALRPYVSPEFLDFFVGQQTTASNSLRNEIPQRLPARGFYYGPIRDNPFYHRLPHFDQFRCLLMVRDPRDVLTSLYFSVAFSHIVPSCAESVREAFFEQRERVRQMGVDAYVLSEAEGRLRIYADYCRTVLGRPNVLLVRYEEMVRDFPTWLEKITTFWGVRRRISRGLRRSTHWTRGIRRETRTLSKLIREANFTVSREDPNSHKRQVQPGDHRRKLKVETVARLNEMFGEILDTLGYDRSWPAERDAA